MHLGALFPQWEIGSDPAAIRDYVQAVEDLGFDHLVIFEHVLGISTIPRPDAAQGSMSDLPIHEPFVLFGYLAGVTRRLELVTSVLILPQRPTALVAKQAAEIDVLSSGRLRLGAGVGWSSKEYQGLQADFPTRGARMDEQIAVLRALWTQPVVTFHGRWHHIEAAGINPLPVQRPIPLWIGGMSAAALRRAARWGDGWMPLAPPNDETRARVEQLRAYLQEAGRAPQTFGIEAYLGSPHETPDSRAAQAASWQTLGATHLYASTLGVGCRSPQEHIDALRRIHADISATL